MGVTGLIIPFAIFPNFQIIKTLFTYYSTMICKLVDLIPALHQSDCRIPN